MESVTCHTASARRELTVMFRFTITLLAVLTLAASAQARPLAQRAAPQALYYSSYGHPHALPKPMAVATTPDGGPTWTAAALAGVAVLLVGLGAGRASVRVHVRRPRHA
jgi:hypothetical protein